MSSTTADAPTSLPQACGALWLATLSLMTAFMQTAAPAHRYLLAQRIARNLSTLREQECFAPHTRETFAKLAARWQRRAERLSPASAQPAGMFARLQRLIAGSS
jgi:hypothetical protein